MPTQPQLPRRATPWFAWLVGGCLGVLALLVLFCAVVAGTLGGLAFRIANRQDASETLSQTALVAGAPNVFIESDIGNVQVATGPDNQVYLAATKHARADSTEDARRELQRASVELRKNGDTIIIISRTAGTNGFGVSLSTDLTVTIPRQATVSLYLQSGDATVEGLEGSVSARLHHGDLHLSDVTLSDTSVLVLQQGNADLSGVLDPAATVSLHLAAGNANVSLPRTSAVHVDAATTQGDVTVSGDLPTEVQHSGAGASVVGDTRSLLSNSPHPEGAALTIRVDSGDITLHFA